MSSKNDAAQKQKRKRKDILEGLTTVEQIVDVLKRAYDNDTTSDKKNKGTLYRFAATPGRTADEIRERVNGKKIHAAEKRKQKIEEKTEETKAALGIGPSDTVPRKKRVTIPNNLTSKQEYIAFFTAERQKTVSSYVENWDEWLRFCNNSKNSVQDIQKRVREKSKAKAPSEKGDAQASSTAQPSSSKAPKVAGSGKAPGKAPTTAAATSSKSTSSGSKKKELVFDPNESIDKTFLNAAKVFNEVNQLDPDIQYRQ